MGLVTGWSIQPVPPSLPGVGRQLDAAAAGREDTLDRWIRMVATNRLTGHSPGRFRGHALLDVRLETGRTHQIRVHMAHIHSPVTGDPVYGGRLRLPAGAGEALRGLLAGFRRQALHATRLTLQHPASGETVSWEVGVPDDMAQLIEALRADARELAPGA